MQFILIRFYLYAMIKWWFFQLMVWKNKFAQFYSFAIDNGEKPPIVSSAAFLFVPFANHTNEESYPARTSCLSSRVMKSSHYAENMPTFWYCLTNTMKFLWNKLHEQKMFVM